MGKVRRRNCDSYGRASPIKRIVYGLDAVLIYLIIPVSALVDAWCAARVH